MVIPIIISFICCIGGASFNFQSAVFFCYFSLFYNTQFPVFVNQSWQFFSVGSFSACYGHGSNQATLGILGNMSLVAIKGYLLISDCTVFLFYLIYLFYSPGGVFITGRLVLFLLSESILGEIDVGRGMDAVYSLDTAEGDTFFHGDPHHLIEKRLIGFESG